MSHNLVAPEKGNSWAGFTERFTALGSKCVKSEKAQLSFSLCKNLHMTQWAQEGGCQPRLQLHVLLKPRP